MRARDNPFATARLHQIQFRLPPGHTWDQLLRRWESLDRRGALVGPEGSGKTTLLEQLGNRLAARGFDPIPVRLDTQMRRVPDDFWRFPLDSSRGPQVILLDGAEQLSGWERWRFRWRARHGVGLIITAHQPCWLPTLFECQTTPRLLADLVQDLLPVPESLGKSDLDAVFHKHQGNLRLALREFYDRFAEQPG